MAYSGYKTVVVKDENEDVLFTSSNLEDAISYATAYFFAKDKTKFDKIMVTDINDSTAVFWSSEELFRAEIPKSDKPSVYIDMDGTLCYWHYDGKGLSYPDEILDPRNHYYRDLTPHEFTVELAKRLQAEGIDVCIMSAADIGSRYDKKKWLQKNCPFIPDDNIFFCPIGADKTQYIKGNVDKSILIDDYNKNLNDWAKNGGKVVKLVNSINSPNPDFDYIEAIPYEKGGLAAEQKERILSEAIKTIKRNLGIELKREKSDSKERENNGVYMYMQNGAYTETMLLITELNIEDKPPVKSAEKGLLSGKSFCITGSLEKFANRDEMIEWLQDNGAKFVSGVSSKTDYLVNNDITSTSGKNKKAKELGIPIVTEAEVISAASGSGILPDRLPQKDETLIK